MPVATESTNLLPAIPNSDAWRLKPQLHAQSPPPWTQSIDSLRSEALGLQFKVDEKLIAFYRLDNGEKLLTPTELDRYRQQLGIGQLGNRPE